MKQRFNKRIGIDARFYGPVGKGLGRYTKEVVDRVIALDDENDYVVFLTRKNFNELAVNKPNVKKVAADVRWYTLAEQVILPFLIWRERIDLMHFPHFNVPVFCPVKFVVTIHDLILAKFSTERASTLSPLVYWFKNLAYRFVIMIALRRARKIIAVSDFTKTDILSKYQVKSDKIAITYEGIADGIMQAGADDDKKTLFRYNIDSPYLLYVGNVYPHKNIERLIRVFSDLSEKYPDWALVLVGENDYFYERVKALASSENFSRIKIRFPGYVPDKYLAILYREALVYVFPSLYEGFGLPPLEAMARGCVVVSSDSSSLPEILGEAALYFNPEDEADMKKQIIRAATDKALRDELRAKGFAQVKKYSWDGCARETLEIYKSVN